MRGGPNPAAKSRIANQPGDAARQQQEHLQPVLTITSLIQNRSGGIGQTSSFLRSVRPMLAIRMGFSSTGPRKPAGRKEPLDAPAVRLT
jgi:hypothetical protein